MTVHELATRFFVLVPSQWQFIDEQIKSLPCISLIEASEGENDFVNFFVCVCTATARM